MSAAADPPVELVAQTDWQALVARLRATATPGQLRAAELLGDEPPACDVCDGARFVRRPAEGVELVGRVLPCRACTTPPERAAMAGIPPRFRGATLGAPLLASQAEALRPLAAWDGQRSLVLAGEAGTGKTHLACALLRRELERDRAGRFVYFPDYLEEVRTRYADDAREQAQAYTDRIASEPLLVLDDLGAERATDWTLEQVRSLIDRRYRRLLPTIVTTNYATPVALGERIGAAAADRLAEWGWLVLGGPSLRRRPAQQPSGSGRREPAQPPQQAP